VDIVVLVKQVPDTAEVKIDPKKGTLIREGVESIVNPEDLNATEAALRIRGDLGGTVTAVSMGPPQAREALLEVLAMGVDRAILLSDPAFAGADTLATSYALGKCLDKIERFDLVLCGRQAIDGDTAQIGPQVAEFLGIPQVTYVQEITLGDGTVRTQRALEDGYEVIEVPLPALLTVTGALNAPRLPAVDGIIEVCGRKDAVTVWNAADIRARAESTGLRGSPTWVVKTESPQSERSCIRLEGSGEERARALVKELRGKNLF
jgi:electron transfer flavoprotein beta subunit